MIAIILTAFFTALALMAIAKVAGSLGLVSLYIEEEIKYLSAAVIILCALAVLVYGIYTVVSCFV